MNWRQYDNFNQNNFGGDFGSFQRGGCGRGVEPIFYDNNYSTWGNNCQGLVVLNPTTIAD